MGLVLVASGAVAPGARAQSRVPIDSFWVTNGFVNQVVSSGGRAFLGGSFTSVGPHTGGAAAIDTATALRDPSFPKVEGEVHAIASDGAGGWFIGGRFSRVGGASRSNIALVLADGRVAGWNPNANNRVNALVVSGRVLYVGGIFTMIGGQTRNRIAALDVATGLATAWNPDGDGEVMALAFSPGTVYVGGSFTQVGGQTRNRIAALDEVTGLSTSWDPNASGVVRALAISGATVYAGGDFALVGGQTRNRIAALDAVSGAATPWDPNADGAVFALATSGAVIYSGGSFLNIGGASRARIAALDAGTGLATPWDPSPNGNVWALLATPGLVYAGGGFTTVGGLPRHDIAAIDDASGVPTAWAPQANSTVRALAFSGSKLGAGGFFSSVNTTPRNRLAALDETTGALTSWDPDANGEVRALAASGGTVYAGGLFTSLGVVARSRIAALDGVTGAVTAWDPNADNEVNALAVSGGSVYAGGAFNNIGGQARARIAELDGTGVATGWNPSADSNVLSLAAPGPAVYAGGTFANAGGQPRSNIAALDPGTGLATTWDPNANDFVWSLVPFGANVYTGGDFTSIGGATRNHLSALDAAGGNDTGWNPDPNGSVRALALSGGTVYLGGTFNTVGGSLRTQLAAVDATTGAVRLWDPNPGGPIFTLAVSSNKVYAGGAFTTIVGGTQVRANFAAFCLAAAPTGLVATPAGTNRIDLSWTGTGAPSYNVYRSRVSGGPFQLLGSPAATAFSDTTAQGGVTYFYVVRAVDQCESPPSNQASASTTGVCNLPPDFDGAAWVEQTTSPTCSAEIGWAPASSPCGPGIFYSAYRDTSPAFIPSASNRIATVTTATTYTDSAALLPGTTFYYVVRATSTANGQEDQNTIRRAITPASCTAGGPDTVQFFAVTAKSAENTLQWQYPPRAGPVTVKIHRAVFPTCPVFPTDFGSLLDLKVGMGGQLDAYLDDGSVQPISNNVTYCYTLFVDKGSGNFSAGRSNRGRPFDTTGFTKWAFRVVTTALVPPGIGTSAIHVVSNDNSVHALEKGAGAAGGLWRSGWSPQALNGPAQGRPTSVPLSVLGSQETIFLGSQDGTVRAVDADTGLGLWSTDLSVLWRAGTQVQAGPAGIFKFIGNFGVPYDRILVGTRHSADDNAFYALNMADGSLASPGWPFTGGGSPIGLISGQAVVDYATRRVFFTSRQRNGLPTDNTVFCVNIDDGSLVWAQPHGNIEASPTLRKGPTLAQDRLYIGTSEGPGSTVKALRADDGQLVWTLTPNDGPIKSFVMHDRLSPTNDFYFSTNGNLWAYSDTGAVPPPQKWVRAFAAPSAPVAIAGGVHVYLGAGDGKLYRLRASDGMDDTPSFPPLTLGDGTAGVGSPTIDIRQSFLYAGSEAGIIYAIQVP